MKKIGLLLVALFIITIVKADDYYWIGDTNGNGDWDQVTNWRVNGSPASSVPSSSDNVFFDKTTSYRVTLKADARCNNITVTGTPRFYSSPACYIYIYGSANFNSTTRSDNRGGVRFRFTSNSTATFTSNDMPNWHHMIIDKEGGKLTITDSINFEYLDFQRGELEFAPNTKGFFDNFRSSIPVTTVHGTISGELSFDDDRILTLNNAYIQSKIQWKYNGAKAVLNAGTSTVEMYATDNRYYEAVGASHLVYNRFLITNVAVEHTHNSFTIFLNTKYLKFTSRDARQVWEWPRLRVYGNTGDSVRIGKLETDRRVDLSQAVVDSAVFNTIGSSMVINHSCVKNAYVEGSAAFGDAVQIDTLALSYGQYYSFNQNQKYKIFEHFRLLGTPCQGPVMFEGGNANMSYMPEFIKTSGTLDIPYGRILNIKTSGGATFNCAGTNENAHGWNFTDYVVAGKNLYWIGGGNYRMWHDPTAWSLTSGGPSADCVPSMYDNVFFDNNSNLSSANNNLDRRVRIKPGVKPYAKDLNIIADSERQPYIHLGSRGIDIYGSLDVKPGFGFADVNNSDTLRFLSPATGNTITTNGINMIRMVFRNPTGEWRLQDPLTLPSDYHLLFHSGTLNTNNQPLSIARFISQGALSRSLILGASNIYTTRQGDWGWTYNGTNMVLDAGSSVIHLTNTHIASDSTLLYNRIINTGTTHDVYVNNTSARYIEQVADPLALWRRVYFQGKGKVDSLISYRATDFQNGSMTFGNAQLLGHTFFRSNNTFDTVTFGDGTTNYFEQNSIQTVRSKANSISTGCNGYSYFTAMRSHNTSYIPTATAKIRIPDTETFHINGANIRWMEGLGTGTYSVAGEDQGNNINWVFTPPSTKNIYWVGGSGDWHDKAHWSATSGGAGGYCLPTEYDNVIFDANSNLNPADSLVVFVANANEAKCRDMTWTGTQGVYKGLHVEQNLYVYGSLDLQQDVNYIVRYFRMYAYTNFTPQTIKSNGAVIKGMMIFGEVNKETIGYWKLQDKLTVEYTVMRINNNNINLVGQIRVYGTFDTDGNDVEARMYTGYNHSTTYWRTSTITAHYWDTESNNVCGFHANAIVHADSSCFIINTHTGQNTQIYLQNKVFNKVITYNRTPFAEVNLHGNFTANHVDIQSGSFTYLRGSVNIKRLDAHYGLRCVEHANVDTFNVGSGEYYFWINKNYNFKIFQDSPLACSQYRVVLNGNAGTVKINSESIKLTNTEFRNIDASMGTGAPYNVTGADLGGNSGLNIGPATIRDLYLVSDSTIVYWDNPNAWALTSGGPASGCIPGRWTNVYVDDNSYVKNPTATLQLRTGMEVAYSGKCYNFTSTRSNPFQVYSERDDEKQALWVYGSIDFNSNSRMILQRNNAALYFKAETPQTIKLPYVQGRTYFEGTGSWTLLSDFIVEPSQGWHVYLRSGDLILNGHTLHAAYIHEDTKTTNYSLDINDSKISSVQLLIPNSVIHNPEGSNLNFINRHTWAYLRTNRQYNQFDTISYDIQYNVGANGLGTTSTYGVIETNIKANSVTLKSYIGNPVKILVMDTVDIKDFKTAKNVATAIIDSIRFEKSSTFGSFYSEANKVAMNGSNTFDSVVIAQNGPVYTFKDGTTQTIRNTAYISGSPCKITTFQSSTVGQLANLMLPRPMTVDFVQFGHINALSYDGTTGTILTAERNSTEMTGTFNQNINFIVAPKTVVGLGPDLTACFKSFPYTISTDGFFAGPSATYEWRRTGNNTIISTDRDLVITTPGTYRVKVNYDPVYTCVQDDTVTILRAAPIPAVMSWDTIRPVCHKDSLVLTVTSPLGANYMYAIQDTTDHTALTFQTSDVFDYVKGGVYYLVVDSLGCLSDSVLVELREPFRSGTANDIIINDTVVCPGTSVVLTPQTSVGLNPVFKWYADDALTTPITTGVGADGAFTTPILTAPVTYYVTISNDTICENLPTYPKAVNVGITNLNCLNANDDVIYVFACDTVTSDVTINDDFHSGYTVNINLAGGMPSKGNISLNGIKIKYTNTSCIGGETDEYKYAVQSPYLRDTATVTVNILRVPEIQLTDSCSFKPQMLLDIQYPYTHQWQYSPDNTLGSWNDIPHCQDNECFEITPGFYRVKVRHSGIETYTKVKELIILKTVLMPGNNMWYQVTLN